MQGEVINAAGPITPLGAGLVDEEVIRAVAEILRRPVDMAELQKLAGEEIRATFGAEAGCVTGCTAAGIAVAVAATMTGTDLARVEQLPDTGGMKDEVLLPAGHDCWFGARVGQMIRIAGARIVAAPTERTAAAVFVASHHVPQQGTVGLAELLSACSVADVPVIVDAAGSVDIAPYLRAGAALVLTSAQKNFGGLTAGIIAGRAGLVAACLLQEHGIGRAMKAGKEAVAGVIAGLRHHRRTGQGEREAHWRARSERVCQLLAGIRGLSASVETDAPEQRIVRARVALDPSTAGMSAPELARRLRDERPPIRVWEAGLAHGHFAIDPRCLGEQEAARVCRSIRDLVAAGG